MDLIGKDNEFLGKKQHRASLRQTLAAAEERVAHHRETEEGLTT